jgi:hypothetical protein
VEGPAVSSPTSHANSSARAYNRWKLLSIRNSDVFAAAEEARYLAVQPPSIRMSVPVINPANSEQR